MGGRDGSSGISGTGKTKGLDVTVNGETTRYYFSSHGGTNYYQRGIDGTPEPAPLNMTAKQFQSRVESNGANVKIVSDVEKKNDENRYKKYRKEMDDFLNREEFNKIAKRGSRMDRKKTRW